MIQRAQQQKILDKYQKGAEKSLMKTMGKFGLCTVESLYRRWNLLNPIIWIPMTQIKSLFRIFTPQSVVVRYADIAASASEWHQKSPGGSTKKRTFHSWDFSRNARTVRAILMAILRSENFFYINMTDEAILYIPKDKSPGSQRYSLY